MFYRLAGLNFCSEWYFYSIPILQAGCSSCSLSQTLNYTAHRLRNVFTPRSHNLRWIHKKQHPPTEDRQPPSWHSFTPHQQPSPYYNQHGLPTPPWPTEPHVLTDSLVWAFSGPVTTILPLPTSRCCDLNPSCHYHSQISECMTHSCHSVECKCQFCRDPIPKPPYLREYLFPSNSPPAAICHLFSPFGTIAISPLRSAWYTTDTHF